jgi:hypothetical protein
LIIGRFSKRIGSMAAVAIRHAGLQACIFVAAGLFGLILHPDITARAAAPVSCVDGVNGHAVVVRMYGRLFSIPVRYLPHIQKIDGKRLYPSQRSFYLRNCRNSQLLVQPLEANYFYINTKKLEFEQDEWSRPINGIDIKLYKSGALSSVRYNRILRKVQDSGRKMKDLPRRGGFYAYDRNEEKPIFFSPFVSDPTGPKTPDGYPVVVECGGWVRTEVRDVVPPKGRCNVRYRWSNGIAISYRFYHSRFPIDKWRALDAGVQAFVRRLMVSEGAEQ